MATKDNKKSKTLSGVVVSHKMAKTVVVKVVRIFKHPKYGKYIRRSKNYKAHDQNGQFKAGDRVTIRETRPLARDKFYEVVIN